MIATMTSKGQITIPKEIRRKIALHAGARVSFVVIGDHVELTPVSTPINALKNILPKPAKSLTLDQIERAVIQGAKK
jgi:AbrB family looped-hinge helix DNA binding protein